MSWLDPKHLETFARENTDAHRLYSARNLWVERFGTDLLISYKSRPALDAFTPEVASWCEESHLKFTRIFAKFLPKQNAERQKPELLVGDPTLPLQTVVSERGVRFSIDFDAGYSCGLFIDQRANRSFLRTLAPARLLNCFAYTCAFSVAAALEGTQTLSVDLSKKSIDRGKENFALNGIGLDNHRFFADDVLETIPRLVRRKETFDAIILDPPTFSRGHKGRRWQVEEHLFDLLVATLELAANDCALLLSTNCARLTRRDLEVTARAACKALHRGVDFHTESLPTDLPEPLVARTLWLMLR